MLAYVSALNLSGAETWASYVEGLFAGLPAITHHVAGSGSATYIGCMLEAAALRAVEVIEWARHTVYPNHWPNACREPAGMEIGYLVTNAMGRSIWGLTDLQFSKERNRSAREYNGRNGLEAPFDHRRSRPNNGVGRDWRVGRPAMGAMTSPSLGLETSRPRQMAML